MPPIAERRMLIMKQGSSTYNGGVFLLCDVVGDRIPYTEEN